MKKRCWSTDTRNIYKLSTKTDCNSDMLILKHCAFPRHLFFEDIAAIRAQERARNEAKLMEILERRHRQMEELADKKGGMWKNGSSPRHNKQ